MKKAINNKDDCFFHQSLTHILGKHKNEFQFSMKCTPVIKIKAEILIAASMNEFLKDATSFDKILPIPVTTHFPKVKCHLYFLYIHYTRCNIK